MTGGDNKPLLTAALEYAAWGKPVFPCAANKQPRIPGGFKNASADPDQIREWWARWPDALIGMPTGRISGLIVIDLDVRPEYDGGEAWSRLEAENGKLPETIESITPSGGTHLWYQHPGFEVRNSAGTLGRGIDVRGDGGYVIVPPSVLPDGRSYQWEASNPRAPAALPAWGLKLLGQRIPPPRSAESATQTQAESGQRNVYLARIAGKLAHAGLAKAQIRDMILAENRRACDPPLSETEIDRTVMKSATKWVRDAGGEQAPGNPEEVHGLRWRPADEWIQEMRAPAWIIENHLERGTLNVIIGGWGSGKSLVQLDRDLRLAHGMSWQGTPCRQELMVYVVGEAQRGFQRRVAAWHRYHELAATHRLIVIPEAVLIGQPDHETAMVVALDEIQQQYGESISHVTLDTLARCFGRDDESSNSDVSRWVNSIYKTITEPTGAATTVLHHPGHGAKDRGRGASALPGAADTEWLISRTGNQVIMTCSKSKDSEFPAPSAWRIFGYSLEIDGASVTAPVVEESEAPTEAEASIKPGTQKARALDVLARMYESARGNLAMSGRPEHEAKVDRTSWLDGCKREGVVSGEAARNAFNRVLGELREDGLITVDGVIVYLSVPSGVGF